MGRIIAGYYEGHKSKSKLGLKFSFAITSVHGITVGLTSILDEGSDLVAEATNQFKQQNLSTNSEHKPAVAFMTDR